MDQLIIDSRTIRPRLEADGETTRALIGEKAFGLTRIPESWAPHFVVLSTRAYAVWKQDPTYLIKHLESNSVLANFVSLHGVGHGEVIVRSSAVAETLDDRGRHESVTCNITIQDITNTSNTLWSKVLSSGSPEGEALVEMALIIQLLIKPRALGHLSNERRVSKNSSNWICEIESSNAEDADTYNIGVKKKDSLIDPLPACKSPKDVELCLRQIASGVSGFNQRAHLEWVWDGARLWVVQIDFEDDFIGSPPCSSWSGHRSSDASFAFKALVEEPQASGKWRKIECVRTFRECSIPTAKLFVLESGEINRSLAGGNCDPRLLDDLNWLCNAPVVIRTDLVVSSGLTLEMLPRTNTVSKLEDAIAFLKENATRFVNGGLAEDQFCFIFHRFIPSKACAYSFSRPGFRRVRIDSTWGFPDSLLYFPHDSFEVDLGDHKKTKRKIRCKYEFLDLNSAGDWVQRKTGRPFDWKPSLSDDFMKEIAHSSYIISNHLNSPIELMFFVDNDTASGHPTCLPWFYSRDVMPKIELSQSIRSKNSSSFTLSTDEDLNALDRLMGEGEFDDRRSPRTLLVKLKPMGEFVRSQDFLKRAVSILKDKNSIVELEGSMLTHSYYLLVSNKIPVKCVNPFNPKPRVRRFGKLVRDLIPVRIQSHGEAAQTITASPRELVDLLKAKAVEEAFELFWESSVDRINEELADLLEVIRSICEVSGMKFEDIVALAEAKRGKGWLSWRSDPN